MLYKEQTEKSLKSMSFSGKTLAVYEKYVLNMIRIKKSAARANFLGGSLTRDSCEAIETACESINQMSDFVVDVFSGGGNIAVHMNVNEVLSTLSEIDIEQINLSQSTADVSNTALRITLFYLIGDFEIIMQNMIHDLNLKHDEVEHIYTIARTCWQDGMQVSAGKLFSAISSAISQNLQKISAIKADLLKVAIGYTVIGSGLGATNAYRENILSQLQEEFQLEFSWPQDPCAAMQYPWEISHLSSLIKNIAAIIAKFCKDLRLLSSGPNCGLNELELPKTQKGSSFFKDKVNPVIPETMMNCEMLITANDMIIQKHLSLGEVHLNIWEAYSGFLLIDNIEMLTKASNSLRNYCIKEIKINQETCKAYAEAALVK